MTFERRDTTVTRVPPRVRSYAVLKREDAVVLAPQARRLALQFGLGAKRSAEIAIVVSELATNIAKHGIRGEITLILDDDAPPRGEMTVIARDIGPPIRDLEMATTDGYDDRGPIDPSLLLSRGGLGTGLGAVLRLSDRFEYHELEEGKEIRARFFR
ncbi:MAG TPA: ATP-binding protein [Thermoanaerobaculia bacterium]|nr:ATP-binding protein [Thermoanaerobaculia bacterium]